MIQEIALTVYLVFATIYIVVSQAQIWLLEKRVSNLCGYLFHAKQKPSRKEIEELQRRADFEAECG